MSTTQDIPTHIYQENLFKEIIAIGLGIDEKDLLSSVTSTHRSKSRELPILEAAAIGSNVSIANLSYNFYFYFLSVQLKQAIPAILLRPLARFMGRIPLSGHVRERDWMVTNFEKAYHNVERMSQFCMSLHSPFEVALVLRYLTVVSELPHNEILDKVLYKTRYGLLDAVDFNAVGSEETKEVIKLCGLEPEDGYCNYDVDIQTPYFSRMNVDIFDTTNGMSSLHVTSEGPLLPVGTGGDLLVPVSEKMRAGGLGNERYKEEDGRVPFKWLARVKMDEDEEREERYKLRHQIHNVYWFVPLASREFTFHHQNPLDTIMGAVMLNNCLTRRVVSLTGGE